ATLTAGGEGIFQGDATQIATVYDTGDFSPFSGFANSGRRNSHRTLVFRADLKSGGQGLFTGESGPPTLLYGTGGAFTALTASTTNNNGTVAFRADLSEGGEAVFVYRQGELTRIADTGELSPFSNLGQITLNDADQPAFAAFLKDGSRCVLTGPDPVADKVLCTGDPLFGSTVNSPPLNIGRQNAIGQFAFSVGLADGRALIVRADPVKAPGGSVLQVSSLLSGNTSGGREVLRPPTATPQEVYTPQGDRSAVADIRS